MKKLSEAERLVKIAEAQAAIGEYFRHFNNYATLMETAAEAQATILYVFNDIIQNNVKTENNFYQVNDMIQDHIMLIKLLKPFAELEGQIYGHED